MKCPNCGTERNDTEAICNVCGTRLDDLGIGQKDGAVLGSEEAASQVTCSHSDASENSVPPTERTPDISAVADPRPYIPADPPTPAPKKTGKVALAVVAAVAVLGAGAFGVSRMMAKDPKEVVIDAFKNVYGEEQTYPMEEIFGFREMAEASYTTSVEAGMTLVLDGCSEIQVDRYKGLGMTLDEKLDRDNQKFSVDLAAIYNHMDLASMNLYYGDDTLMLALPELVDQVFVADLGDGLADRVKNSPTLGPVMEQQGVDVEGLFAYIRDLMETAQSQQSADPYGIQGAWERYREGCKAQENFKAALTVEKAGKGQYQMGGQEVKCSGYQVHISKDSIISFLRTSSDFFLEDEELKEAYLKNLRTGTKLLEFMGTGETLSAEEMQQEAYDSIREQAENMISQLDQGMGDVDMTVFVDKKGRLAALDGTTTLVQEDGTNVPVNFSATLEGGAYLTQNAQASVKLELPEEPLELKLEKTGLYDGKELDSAYRFLCKDVQVRLIGHYTVEGGAYELRGEVAVEGQDQGSLEVRGVVDQLEKGKSIHLDMDAIRLEVSSVPFDLTMSGDYYIGPMSGAVEAPQGETMDVFAATEDDWQAVMMRAFFSLMGIMGQIQ